MTPIRLGLAIDTSKGTGSVEVTELARALDASFSLSAQKIGSAFDASLTRVENTFKRVAAVAAAEFIKAAAQINTSFTQTLTQLAAIEAAVGRIKSAGGGGAPPPPPGTFNLGGQLSSFLAGGFGPTGRSSSVYTTQGQRLTDRYIDESGRILNATTDPNGNLSSLRLGLTPAGTPFGPPKPTAAQVASNNLVASIASANAANAANLAARGFSLTGSSRTVGPDGTSSLIQQFRGADGVVATLNTRTGQLTERLREAEQAGNQTGLSIIRFSAALYAIERVGRILRGALIDPFVDFTKHVIEATEKYRQFEVSIAGVVGGQSKAGQIDQQLALLTRNSPLTISQAQDAARSFAFIPSSAARLGLSTPQGAASQFLQFGELLNKLAILDPVQGVSGAGVAVRELLAGGEATSLRRRLEINPETVSRSIGKPLRDILNDPELAVKALTRFTDIYVGNQAFQGQRGLYSNASQKLGDARDQLFAGIGNAGVYDAIVGRIRGLTEQVTQYVSSPAFGVTAKRISDALIGTIDNILNSILNLAGRFTGSTGSVDTIEKIGDVVASVFEAIEYGTRFLPQAAAALGNFFHDLYMFIKELMDFARNPEGKIAGRLIEYGGALSGNPQAMLNILARNVSAGTETGYGFGGGLNGAQGVGGVADLASPFLAAQQMQRKFESAQLPLNVRIAMNGLIDPINRAGGTFEYESPFTKILGKTGKIPEQIERIFQQRSSVGGEITGYPQLLARAQADAKRAGGFRDSISGVSGGFGGVPFLLTPDLEMRGRGVQLKQRNEFFDNLNKNAQDSLEAVEKGPENIGLALKSLKGALAQSLKDLGPLAGAQLADSINDSVFGVADAIEKAAKFDESAKAALHKSLNDVPFELQRLIDGQLSEAKIRRAQAGIGEISPTAGSKDLKDYQFMSDRARAQAQVEELQKRIAAQGQRLDDQITEYQKRLAAAGGNAKDPQVLEQSYNVATAQDDYLASQKRVQEQKAALRDLSSAYQQFALEAREAVENNLGKAINDLILGTGNLKDALRSFAQDIVSTFSKLASQQIIQGLFGDLFTQNSDKGFVTTLGGLFGNLFGGGSAAANGAVFGGGFQAFAAGGVVNRPTLGLIGEGTFNEAVVPLPDGKSIPVSMRNGGTGGGATAFIIVDSRESAVASGYQPGRDVIIDTVGSDFAKGGPLSKMIRKLR